MRIALVLRTGGEYHHEHVQALVKNIQQHDCLSDIVCLTDMPRIAGVATIPLTQGWPGWWAKMELFRPDIEGDLLYIDLDTFIRGELTDIASVRKLTILRDFYRDGTRRPEGLQSSMMYLPEADRADVWAIWHKDALALMRKYKLKGVGDQALLESIWMGTAQRWQDVVPGQIVSYKIHCQSGAPAGSRVVCFHGKPRPWALPPGHPLRPAGL